MARFVLCFAIALFCASSVLAQETISPALEAELRTIAAIVAEVRELQPRQDTAVEFLAPQDVGDGLEILIEYLYPADWIDSYQHFLMALDLLAADVDLGALIQEFLSENVGGYYDFHRDTMVVITWSERSTSESLALPEKAIYAHEYAHALQDQHFDLAAIWQRAAIAFNFDAELAHLALVEGDAMLTEQFALQRLLYKGRGAVDAEFDLIDAAPPLADSMPPILQRAFYFPYLDGAGFVFSLHRNRGWRGVNRALSDHPPVTTEQIIHPERYLAREGAKTVKLPDDSALLAEGWRRLYDSAIGEFYLRQHLQLQLQDGSVEKLADGWGGDHLRIYKQPNTGELIWLWYQVWDTVADAEEFAEHYPRYLDSRFGSIAYDGDCWRAETSRCFARVSATETRVSMAIDRSTAFALLTMPHNQEA